MSLFVFQAAGCKQWWSNSRVFQRLAWMTLSGSTVCVQVHVCLCISKNLVKAVALIEELCCSLWSSGYNSLKSSLSASIIWALSACRLNVCVCFFLLYFEDREQPASDMSYLEYQH